MRKFIIILLIFILSSFSFANTNSDLQTMDQSFEDMQNQLLELLNEDNSEFSATENSEDDSGVLDIEKSMEDAQNQLLQILDDDERIDSIDIIQEGNEDTLNKIEEINEGNEKKARNLIRNDSISCYTLGFNFPLTYFPQEDNFEKVIPYGVSVGLISASNMFSVKANLNWDHINASIPSVVSLTGSLGFAPVHNDYLLMGCYFTIGFENANNNSVMNIGGSGTIAFKFFGNLRLFLNLDALYRTKKEETYFPLINTFRVSPSIGLVFGY